MKRGGLFLSWANAAFSRTPISFQSLRHLSSHQLPAEARRLDGKVAIITGGAGGIGAATAKLFVSHGAHVIIADVRRDLGSEVASSLGPQAHFFPCNVAVEGDVSAAVDLAVSRHGHLDIMYNNAGIADKSETSTWEASLEEFQGVMDVNLKGALMGAKHAARAMTDRKRGGSILFTCSLAGTLVVARRPYYTISKHAMVGAMKCAASDLAPHGIRVNCISPTLIIPPGTAELLGCDVKGLADKYMDLKLPEEAVLATEDVANAAMFLSSDEGRFISGQNLVIDGAFSASRYPSP